MDNPLSQWDNNKIMPRKRIILTTRADVFSNARVPVSTGWLLGDCMEFRGKQDLWTRQRPELLQALREQAIIQSAESSNRIEGVTIAANRLRPVVLDRAAPADRPEEELAGYRRALDWIFSRRATVRMQPRTLLHLHRLCQQGVSDAGVFKARDNEIIEITKTGQRLVRFRPTRAADTPGAAKQMCDSYNSAIESHLAPPLLLVASAIFDFLCIHPFRDGNGRVSRLLTTFLLEQQGFIVGRFVSLERLIEQSKEEYYQVLKQCSAKWETGENLIVPWWNYFLGIVRRGYVEFSEKMQRRSGPAAAKSDLVKDAVSRMTGSFNLAQIQAQVPGVSGAMVKKVLLELKRANQLKLSGRGRGALWEHAE